MLQTADVKAKLPELKMSKCEELLEEDGLARLREHARMGKLSGHLRNSRFGAPGKECAKAGRAV